MEFDHPAAEGSAATAECSATFVIFPILLLMPGCGTLSDDSQMTHTLGRLLSKLLPLPVAASVVQ
jgi:hypothetical protein